VLKDHPDLPAETAQAVGVQSGDIDVIDQNLAAARRFEAIDQTQHRTFASAGVADQTKHLAVLNPQAGGVQCGDFPVADAIGFMDVLKLDHLANLVGAR